jgi:hypothetical protein
MPCRFWVSGLVLFILLLLLAVVTEVSDVAAESKTVSVEPDQNMGSTVLDEEFIKNNLPDNEDDLRAYLQALAGPAAGGVSLLAQPAQHAQAVSNVKSLTKRVQVRWRASFNRTAFKTERTNRN